MGSWACECREITDALNAEEPVAHSTVQTLLRQLEAKGAVGHEATGRTFVFFPRLKEDKVKRTATRDLLERVFGGSVGSLVAHLLKNERLSKTELDELKRLIDSDAGIDWSGDLRPRVTGEQSWGTPLRRF